MILGILFVVSLFNYLDRNLLAILMPLIKAELRLSDTAIGFLNGTAFSIFYVLAGLPIAWLADRYHRGRIIGLALFVWSLITISCGGARNFVELSVARVLVGIGEAGCSPPAHALIADIVPPERRASSLALYALGSPIGLLSGFLMGGYLADALGWRATLALVGFAGCIFSLAVFWLVDDRRDISRSPMAIPSESIIAAVRSLLAQPAFFHLAFGASLIGLVNFAIVQWFPSFLNRSFGMSLTTIGASLAGVLGVSGVLGIAGGAMLADRMGKGRPSWALAMCALAVLLSAPLNAVTFSTDSLWLVLAVAFVSVVLSLSQAAPSYAVTQFIAGEARRAIAAATLLFVINVVSGALGPLIVGSLSDHVFKADGIDALRQALLVVTTIAALWAALHFWLARRALIAIGASDRADRS